MVDDLSVRAKRLLANQHAKLFVNESVTVGASAALTEILLWCEELEFTPGRWLKANKRYQFNRQSITQIDQILTVDKFASIFDDFSEDNHQSAAQRNPKEKQAKHKPTHHLILAAMTKQPILEALQQEFYLGSQINLELDVDKLHLDKYDCLVVIENRDSFNDWHQYFCPVELMSALVVYRGDKHHSTACKKLLKTWQEYYQDKPVIYFGDFDLAGLRIALSAGYTHLLLPEYRWLSEHVIKQHYPLEQEKYLTRLLIDCPNGWQTLLTLMSKKRAGMRQQKMYNTPLTLYCS